MSGGGSNKKKSTAATSSPTASYTRAPTTRTFQPTLPGFMGMVADQLAAGYGGQDFMPTLSSLYKPMNVMSYAEPISTTAGAFDKKKYAPISSGNPILDALLMGGGKVGKVEESKEERTR